MSGQASLVSSFHPLGSTGFSFYLLNLFSWSVGSSFLSLSLFFHLLHFIIIQLHYSTLKKPPQLWKKRKEIIWFSLPWRELNTPKEKFWYILCTHLHAASEVNISIIAHFRTRYPVPRYNNCQESMRNKEFSRILAHNLTSINNFTVVHKLRNGLLPGISLLWTPCA